MTPPVVVFVLREGGIYRREWVARLAAQVDRHLPGASTYVSTDDRWPGWWAKLSLFDPDRFAPGERLLYLDLDSLVVGDLSEIASYDGDFAAIRSFIGPDMAQSGVMAWTPGEASSALWDRWTSDPDRWMREYRGDGEFLDATIEPDNLLDLYPEQIVSWKRDATEGPPRDARVVCMHGYPKQNEVASGWARDYWLRW